MKLSTRRALLVAPKFHTYHEDLIEALESLSYDVVYLKDKPTSTLYKIVSKFSMRLKSLIEKWFFLFNAAKYSKAYDLVLVVKGQALQPGIIESLKKNSPGAKFVFYQWDSIQNNPNFWRLYEYFDSVVTFDPRDARDYGLGYLPLFYTKFVPQPPLSDRPLDILFVGTLHSERLVLVKKLVKFCKERGIYFKFHIYCPLLLQVRYFISGKIKLSDLSLISFRSISRKELRESYISSKVVFDVPLGSQSGLTIRSIEALGAGAILYTSNETVVELSWTDFESVQFFDSEEPDFSNLVSLLRLKSVGFPPMLRGLERQAWLKCLIGADDE